MWQATHRIHHDGRIIDVMLHGDGNAYDAAEWYTNQPADYAKQRGINGRWTFKGEPFEGSVRRVGGQVRVVSTADMGACGHPRITRNENHERTCLDCGYTFSRL